MRWEYLIIILYIRVTDSIANSLRTGKINLNIDKINLNRKHESMRKKTTQRIVNVYFLLLFLLHKLRHGPLWWILCCQSKFIFTFDALGTVVCAIFYLDFQFSLARLFFLAHRHTYTFNPLFSLVFDFVSFRKDIVGWSSMFSQTIYSVLDKQSIFSCSVS